MICIAYVDREVGFMALSSPFRGFFWEQSQGWPFKTVENFCPITCGCDNQNSERTGCPTPLERTCEEIASPGSRCITYNQPLS